MNGADVHAISAPPITRRNCSKRIVKRSPERIDGLYFQYLPILNFPIIKNLNTILLSFFSTVRALHHSKESIVLCDVLNMSVSSGALLAAKLLGRESIGIITDLPDILANGAKRWSVRYNNWMMRSFSCYVFLTEQMNQFINIKNKPYVVIEGQVDINMQNVKNLLDDKYPQKVCMYTGGIHKIYGIKTLVDAFILSGLDKMQLHIYGSGDYCTELMQICRDHENIKYFGEIPNDMVVMEQLKATLLINPRPSQEEFTKYSFPSKNMEYMASGTPTLTTTLPGMPDEYLDFLYVFKEETPEGMAETLKHLLSKGSEELHEQGRLAKAFVLEKKNNKVQAGKIIEMIKPSVDKFNN
jgi:glycosyltransferase involved in cell wall biosynthesis